MKKFYNLEAWSWSYNVIGDHSESDQDLHCCHPANTFYTLHQDLKRLILIKFKYEQSNESMSPNIYDKYCSYNIDPDKDILWA